jgi:hypothetical protein
LVVEPGALVRCDPPTDYLAVCDFGAAAIDVEPGGALHVDGYLTGAGVTGTPGRVRVWSEGNIVYSNLPTIAGFGTESSIGGDDKAFSDWPYVALNMARTTLKG